MQIDVVTPTLNAAAQLEDFFGALEEARASGLVRSVCVADGGSSDNTGAIALRHGAYVVRAERGRGRQLRAGAEAAAKHSVAPWFLFLHADTVLQEGWQGAVVGHMEASPHKAAAFTFALDDEARAARRLEAAVAWRCRVFALPYGDQGLLISRELYQAVGGFDPFDLFEDVALVRRLGRARLVMLPVRAVTSAARFRKDGYGRRSRRNLVLLLRYLLGASPDKLARAYD